MLLANIPALWVFLAKKVPQDSLWSTGPCMSGSDFTAHQYTWQDFPGSLLHTGNNQNTGGQQTPGNEATYLWSSLVPKPSITAKVGESLVKLLHWMTSGRRLGGVALLLFSKEHSISLHNVWKINIMQSRWRSSCSESRLTTKSKFDSILSVCFSNC